MDGPQRLCRLFYSSLRTVLVLVNNLYCIPTYVVWCVLFQPLYYFNPDWYWYYEGIFFDWLLAMVAFWSYSAGYRIIETGDKIDTLRDEETLILVNHQSTSDVPLLMHCFASRPRLLEKLNWVMDAVFQYTNFGIVSTLHGDFFINAGRNKREASLKELESYLKTKFLPRQRKWLVLFPEGGFLRKRKEASKRYAEKMNLPNLEYVTLPRLGAIQTIIDTLGHPSSGVSGFGDTANASRLKYIVDMTIAYPEGEPLDLGNVITGYAQPCKIRMHYKIYPLHEVPHQKPEKLQSWLYNLYIEKNNMLGHYYQTGVWNPEFSKLDVNDSVQSGKMESVGRESENAYQTRGAGSDVVDEARSVPSMVDDDGLLRRRVPSVEDIHLKSNDTELIPGHKSSSRQCSGDEECVHEPNTGEFNSKTIHLDLLRMGLLHSVFILSSMLHIQMIRSIYNFISNL